MFMILGPNSKVAQRARDAQRLALAAAEKEKAQRDGTDGRPPSADKPEDAKAEEKPAVEVAPPPAAPAAVAEVEAPKP
jgi:translation initiation factor IF-3